MPPAHVDNRDDRFFPDIGAPEFKLLAYRDRLINPWSMHRNQDMARIAEDVAMFLGHQWQEIDYSIAFDGVRGAFLREIDDEDDGPRVRPVTNKIDPMVEMELIALVKRSWEPKVMPTWNDPRLKAAAQVANDRLLYILNEQLSWPEKRHQLGLHFAVQGTGMQFTSWDRSYMHLKPKPSPYAVRCTNPNCQTKLYSREIPADVLRLGVDNGQGGYKPASAISQSTARPVMPSPDDPHVEDIAELGYCPTCTDPFELEDYEPNEDEAASGVDVFGRPLGVDQPEGNVNLEIDIPCEWYLENAGIKVSPDTLRRFGRRKIRSQEWLEEHYPHIVHEIPPDSIHDLLYGDPVVGSYSIDGWHSVYDIGIFDNHNNVDELVDLPSFRHPYGRYVVCVKDMVLEDGPLYEKAIVPAIDGQGNEEVWVPRVMGNAARFKIRPDNFLGTSIVTHQKSKQRRLNGLDSQVVESRLRMGSPHLLVSEDQWPEGGGQFDSYGPQGVGRVYRLKPSLLSQGQLQPQLFGNTLMNPEVYQERDRIITDLKEDGSLTGPPRGFGEKNVSTTSGLQLMVEQDAKSRSLREDELVNSTKKAWRHILDMEWILGHDNDDVYKIRGPNKSWKYDSYKGAALRGQTEVDISRGAFIEQSLIQREAAREALADQVVVIDGPVTRAELAEIYGVPGLNKDTNAQVDHANRVLADFKDKGIVRVLDLLDDPFIHVQVLGTWLKEEEGDLAGQAVKWDDISRAVAGWEDELTRAIALDVQAEMFYQGRPKGDAAKEAYALAELGYQKQLEVYEQQKMVSNAALEADAQTMKGPKGEPATPGAAAVSAAAAVPPQPPQKPPPPVFLPGLMQDKIFLIWTNMLKDQGIELQPQEADTPFKADPVAYVQFRALVTAYKLAVSPLAPAPGSGATMLPSDKGTPVAGGAAGAGGGQPPSAPPTAPMPKGGAN